MKGTIFALAVILVLACGCVQGPAQKNGGNATNISPQAPLPQCSDTDSGPDISAMGSVSFNGSDYADSCKNGSVVSEYYCESGRPAAKELPCPSGTGCAQGACSKPSGQNETAMPQEPCSDSDGGNDIWASGAVVFENLTYQDSCQGGYDVLEYYCESGRLKQDTKGCGSGNKCESGSCIPLNRTCSDSGSGELQSGIATQYGGGMVVGSMSDSCIDNGSKADFFCQGASIESKTVACPDKTYCYGGACIPLCTDYDGGADTKAASYAKDASGSHYDYCTDETHLAEYVCSDAGAQFQRSECGGACLEGRCYDPTELKCREYLSGREVRLLAGTTAVRNETDSCVDFETIMDYRCISNRIEFLYQSCDDGEICYDADCLAITAVACYDLDAGSEDGPVHVASETVETSNHSIKDVKEDYCFNDNTLAEYSCSGKSSAVDFIQCPQDEKCLGGACVYPYTCSDSDGGASYQPGAATLSEGETVVRTEHDACTSGNTIHEVLCTEEGKIAYELLECPDNTSCDSIDGSCK